VGKVADLKFLKSRVMSFKHAFIGWWHVIRTQQNAWIHAVATGTTILVAVWLNLPLKDWAVLVLAITIVWIAEFLNTALEIVVDLASPRIHPLAKAGKDVGAAAVLIAAASAIVVGVLIMGPPLIEKLGKIADSIGLFRK
jgi:diacylglycerol kinase (ATP)